MAQTLVGSGVFKSTLEQAYENERVRLLDEKGFDETMSYNVGAPETSPLTGSLPVYVHRLRTFVLEFFQGSPYEVSLLTMLDRLEHHIPPPLYPDEPMEKTVYSTNVGGMAEVPKTFLEWDRMLASDGWNFEVADDDMMEHWFGNLTAGTGVGTERFREFWNGIHKPVLKSDFLRYARSPSTCQ